jgi:DNA-binding response OmpR family regulator
MRLYLVEDDQRLARSYQRHLQDDGHEVDLAYDGEVALQHLRTTADEYTVIILDVMLPRRDGISVCRALRQAGVTTPILVLTALDQTEDKVAGLDAGADDYLTKPFPIDELLARLRALARRSPHFVPDATATNVQVGPLTLDLLRHEAYFHNALVPLTAREFTLLEYLARNAGRVLTRTQLMLHVWPDGTEAGSNVLDTYIRYLREKLEFDAIITVRGIGYRLRSPQEWAAI